MERQTNKRRRDREEEAEKKVERRVSFKERRKGENFLAALEDGEGDSDVFQLPDSFRPLGVFEFPWEKENLVSEMYDHGSKTTAPRGEDVFFCPSLLDCCSVEILGEGRAPPPMLLPGEKKLEDESRQSDAEEIDGVDCIWSCALNQPLSLGPSKIEHFKIQFPDW